MISVCTALLVCGCNSTKVEKDRREAKTWADDPHSAAVPELARVTHLNWEAEVSFETQILKATAHWTIEKTADADTLVLDTRGLKILKITRDASDAEIPFRLGAERGTLGQALYIPLTPETKQVHISYTTDTAAAALQWLSPEQTAGKKSPFLFTQSQAILARTWIPCQDSPGIRFSYEATVKVPAEYLAVMSATNPVEKNATGVYRFTQEKAIPSYLMALAAGDIAFQAIGERSGVYAEPAMLEKAAWELQDMEKMMQAAENLYGPYAWGRYDVLILPPSFPFGGMENPVLTFATPTIIAGDRSLVALIAHELAHSWSGNLVTNSTWNDFWLNEGFTVYFERRIMEAIEGKSYAEMLVYLGYDDLRIALEDFEAAGLPQYTCLKLKLDSLDPDEGMNDIAYEKGYAFLVALEHTVGRENMDAFLKAYFQENAFTSVTTEEFLGYLDARFSSQNKDWAKGLSIQQWIYEPGMPEEFTAPVSSRFQEVEKQGDAFLSGQQPESLTVTNWSSHEWQYFLRYITPKLKINDMPVLDKAFQFSKTGNSEIAFLWYLAAVKTHYAVVYPNIHEFLNRVGRRKFLTPLYKAMMHDPETKSMAKEIYAEARKNYHAVSIRTLDEVVEYGN